MKKFLVIASLMFASAGVFAAGGHDANLDKANVDLADTASLQRGARTFVNYCLSCHSAAYMRYERMANDLGISHDVVVENMMFASDKIGELMTTNLSKADAKKWFGTSPPDLSLTARSRGADYIYTYMRSFYRDPDTVSGWNNTVFPNVAMPHVMHEWQGTQSAVFSEDADGNKQFEHFEQQSAGTMSAEEYDQAMRDLTNFMVYLAEPAKLVRYKIGFWVIVFLLVMVGLSYALKKEYWRDVH